MTPQDLGLATDLYELTMVDSYLAEGMLGEAVFSLFVRRLPRQRDFLLAAGLADALECIEQFRFGPEALRYLASLQLFSDELLRYLEGFRFSGEVRALPEGTLAFAQEPLLEVIAPLPEAQLLETIVMNQVQLQTVAATKTVLLVEAARGRSVVDFGMRRAHGLEAALKVARAAYVAGLSSTSNVLAGQRYGVPVAGTMAHSYVQAHASELEAFRAFARRFPRGTLLVDTYDALEGVRNVIRLARERGPQFQTQAVRLDSGDLSTLARQTRALLDEAGLGSVEVFASGGLDEDSVSALVEGGAPIQGFGVGTALAVAEGAPSLDIAYKLVAYAGEPRMKLSSGKVTYPHAKQVFRTEQGGTFTHDVLACRGEVFEGRPLLETVVRGGQRTGAGLESLEAGRKRAREELDHLPAQLRRAYPVRVSERLLSETERLTQLLQHR